jgi:dienelactone hydrolase
VTNGLLAKGFAVMALDAQYHGERAIYNDYVDVGEMVFKRGWGVRYSNMLTQSIVDYRRAMDYLATRDDIDANRIGILGYSMGGHMTFILGANEPRIKAIVACVVPKTEGLPLAATNFSRRMGGTPLLMLMARKDTYYSVEDAQLLFSGVPGNDKTLRLFDSGHSLPARYAEEAATWLAGKL